MCLCTSVFIAFSATCTAKRFTTLHRSRREWIQNTHDRRRYKEKGFKPPLLMNIVVIVYFFLFFFFLSSAMLCRAKWRKKVKLEEHEPQAWCTFWGHLSILRYLLTASDGIHHVNLTPCFVTHWHCNMFLISFSAWKQKSSKRRVHLEAM